MVSCGVWSAGVRDRAGDGRGCEDGALLFARHFEHVPQPVHTDVPSQFGLVLCHHRKQRSQVVDRIDVVLLHHGGNGGSVGHIANFAGTALAQHFVGFSTRDVAGHDIVVAVNAAKFHGEFRTDLSGGTDDQNFFH